MRTKRILAFLAGGDRRSIGRSDQVSAMVAAKPALFSDLIAGLWHEDPLIRMRAADAAEKATRKNPELLLPHKRELLGLLSETDEQEVCWHLAAMVPRLPLTVKERKHASAVLNKYLSHRSSIVKTFALQALADFAKEDASLRPEVTETLRQATRTGTPAMKARSRRLLLTLK